MLNFLIFLIILVSLSLAQEEDILIKTPLVKKLEDFNVSVGIVSIEELKKNFPRAYALLEKHHGAPLKYDTHQYGENYGGWFQMAEKGPYSINLYIKGKEGKTRKVNLQYNLE
ncbi:MAG: hypothetical protein ACK4LA_05775 [Aquificaceae bacterium]